MEDATAESDAVDRNLVQRYLDGDRRAATDLVDRYQRPLFNVALRMLGNAQDAEDATQEVLTVNQSLNVLKGRKTMVTLEDQLSIPAAGVAVDDAVEAEEQVRKALTVLKPDDRAVVVLRYFGSLSYEEIAEVLEVTARTVKSRLFTARERLRAVLISQGGD